MSPSPSLEAGDFTVPDQVTIPAGPIPSAPVCIPISTTPDLFIEGNHDFTLSIQQPANPSVAIGTPSTATVTINDNDGTKLIVCMYIQ